MPYYTIPSPQQFIGKYDGKNTHLILLQNSSGMQVALTDYGARVVSVIVSDKFGDPTDVVLGFGSIAEYWEATEKYHGATVGRYANRIANGRFKLDGSTYELKQNNGTNSLHGGERGFHDRVWDRQVSFEHKVDFYYVSPDGEEGFPGNVKVHVSYELTNENELRIRFRAATDRRTVLNLTNHAYFNLEGEGSGNVLEHAIQIPARHFLPLTEEQVPTGERQSVERSAFDFSTLRKIGDAISLGDAQLDIANGFDHSFVNTQALSLPAATAFAEKTGIQLDIFTSEPSIHLYTGNSLDGSDTGKSGNTYGQRAGFCFEAQHFPDSPNQPDFPSVILEKGKEYKAETTYKFSIKK